MRYRWKYIGKDLERGNIDYWHLELLNTEAIPKSGWLYKTDEKFWLFRVNDFKDGERIFFSIEIFSSSKIGAMKSCVDILELLNTSDHKYF